MILVGPDCTNALSKNGHEYFEHRDLLHCMIDSIMLSKKQQNKSVNCRSSMIYTDTREYK
jgi:hypothetical protein